ncbi:MAG: alpha/beta hydrolase [Planctomycetaceae bacterium]|nr:alpha/beta hydrolase [Planctomycetaceae bacterium]
MFKLKIRKRFLYLLFGMLFAVVYVVGCQADFIARRLAFHPPKFPAGDWDFVHDSFTEVQFKNSREQVLVGRYIDFRKTFADDTERAGRVAIGSILYCHGNAENISYITDFAIGLSRDLGCNVFIFDYAGYGKSESTPTTVGILDDGRAARDWLAKHDRIAKDAVIVYGQSLGGCVAVDIAAKDGARGLIVESSFTSLDAMGKVLLPFLPVKILLKERLASVEKIGGYRGKTFISHGKADRVIPFAQGEKLYEAANAPKTFYIPPSGKDQHSAWHCNEHREKLREFVAGLE